MVENSTEQGRRRSVSVSPCSVSPRDGPGRAGRVLSCAATCHERAEALHASDRRRAHPQRETGSRGLDLKGDSGLRGPYFLSGKSAAVHVP